MASTRERPTPAFRRFLMLVLVRPLRPWGDSLIYWGLAVG